MGCEKKGGLSPHEQDTRNSAIQKMQQAGCDGRIIIKTKISQPLAEGGKNNNFVFLIGWNSTSQEE